MSPDVVYIMSPDVVYIMSPSFITLVEVPYQLSMLHCLSSSLSFLCVVVTGASEGIGKGYATEVKPLWNEGMST